MDATVLPLTWPKDFDLSDLRRFETEARTLRYQALGRACREKRINSLMVAHHGDDQAETVMMRLSNSRLRSGLQAMQSVEWIPECDGIYGVQHSGLKQKHDTSLNIPFPVEQGGIQILRPLLAFEKSRLIATCEEKGVAWAEDKTNQIQTITSRNAIRHIYKNHKLPEALSIKSLVNIAHNMQKRVESHKAYAQKLFDRCLIKLDIQTGCLLVRFPPASSLLDRPVESEHDRNEARDNAYCLIERVAELVTPMPKAQAGQLAGMIQHIYPELKNPEEADYSLPDKQHFTTNRCVFGIWWRKWGKPSPFQVPEEGFYRTGIHPREWFLIRQPLDRTQLSSPAHHIIYPPLDTTRRSGGTYKLFDGRFWIRLQNHSTDTLILRLFGESDMRHLPTAQEDRKAYLNEIEPSVRPHRYISAAFSLIKPSELRFSLPAVFCIDKNTGEETLLGFPTLDVRMNGFGPLEGVCGWSVRYKKIDFGNRSASDIIVPGSSRPSIIAEEKRQAMQHKGIIRMKMRENQSLEERAEDDRFTGFKRVSIKSVEKKGRHNYLRNVFVKAALDDDSTDLLSFLQEESAKQEGEKEELGRRGDGE